MFQRDGATKMAETLGISIRAVYSRRNRLEKALDRPILSPNGNLNSGPSRQSANREVLYPARVPITIENGVVLVGSDAHYWPEEISCAHRAYLYLARELQPKAVYMDGDAFDGARISRHPPIGWTQLPTVKQELECVELRMTEIENAAPKAERLWMLGNHDMRFENRLAAQAPEFEGIPGFTLKDQFPRWQIGISSWINDNTVVKHRFKGGIHATHNNTLWAGMSIVTGHLHSLKVTPFDDYRSTRYGVDTGTLADPYGPQFDYQEDNPRNHRSGLAVLTYFKGRLLWPEVARVIDATSFEFRGRVISV